MKSLEQMMIKWADIKEQKGAYERDNYYYVDLIYLLENILEELGKIF